MSYFELILHVVIPVFVMCVCIHIAWQIVSEIRQEKENEKLEK